MATTLTDRRPAYCETFLTPDDHPEGRYGYACNVCHRPVDVGDGPCPDHAPRDVPGLQLLSCDASPAHRVWVVANDGYEPPCLQCLLDRVYAAQRAAAQCRHWPWRRWSATRRVFGWLYASGVVAGFGTTSGDGHDGCVNYVRWTGRRVYVAGVPVATWRCWSRGHRRGEHVGLGYCGKCVPWPCCGSTRVEHNDGCMEDR